MCVSVCVNYFYCAWSLLLGLFIVVFYSLLLCVVVVVVVVVVLHAADVVIQVADEFSYYSYSRC